ncbi:MAG: serine hydrolase [Pseudomonadota bacterium]
MSGYPGFRIAARSRGIGFGVASLACALLSPAFAAPAATDYARYAGAAPMETVLAGYRALFTCSAHFHAGRALDDIERVELVDTQAFELPPPQIDARRRFVRAAGPGGETAVAAYRDSMGCTLLPPDWSEADLASLPYVAYPPVPNRSAQNFPDGDRVRLRTPASLRPLLRDAFDGATYGDGSVTTAVLIAHRGKLIAERYAPGFGPRSGYRTWSTAKSITATLIGIAVGDGLLEVDAPAPIPEWRHPHDPRAAIRLVDLLQMSSGLESSGSNTNALYFGGAAILPAITTTRLEAPPGTRWQYANNDTLLLLRALEHVLDDRLAYLRFPYDRLLHKLGMFDTRMETDHAGRFMGSSQVYTTARDLMRFGLFYAAKGVWRDERILPEGWTDFVAQAAPARPRKAGERGYGAQFWLLDTMPGVPAGTYTSAGNKGQYVTVVPGADLVIVRTGVDPNGKRWAHDRLVAAVAAAL